MASKEQLETLHEQQRELRQQMESSAAWREELCQTLKTIEQEVDHAKRAAQSPQFQAKMAELDDQVRMVQQRAGSMDGEAKREFESMERDAKRSQQRQDELLKGLETAKEGIKCQVEKSDVAMVRTERRIDLEAQEGAADGVPRLADPVQDKRREDRLRQYAEQAKDRVARVQKALRDATAQAQEVRILRDSATTMVVDAKDHMQQQAPGVESSRMSVETAPQEVLALRAALEFDSRLVQRPEQQPVCAFSRGRTKPAPEP